MTEQIISYVVKALILIMVSLITTYVIPFIKSKIDLVKLQTIAEWAFKYVNMAENIYNDAQSGAIKLEDVTKKLEEECTKLAIKLTADEIRALIEEAVNKMNNEKK